MTKINGLENNPAYQRGILFDKGFYKENIVDGRTISEISLNRSVIISVVVEVAKKVSLIALIAIPSFMLLGSTTFIAVFFAGVTASVIDESITSEHSPLKRILNHAKLNAHINSVKKLYQPVSEFIENAAIPAAIFHSSVMIGGFLSSAAVYSGAFFAGKVIADDIMALGLDLTERRAKAYLAKA